MFWTDYGNPPKIESAKMDGTGRNPIVSSNSQPFSNLLYPNDVVVDLNTDLVYFSDGSAGIVGVVTMVGGGGRVIVNENDNPQLRRSQPVTRYIHQPRSLSLRHLTQAQQDGNEDTEETELFWTNPEVRTVSAANLVTTGRRTGGIEKFHLRSILPRTTRYKALAVQFVSMNGHKKGGEIRMLCDGSYCDAFAYKFIA